MNRIKRITAFALLSAMTLNLSGCSLLGGAKEPVAITVWHYYNDVQQQAFNDMVSEFNNTVGTEKNIVVSAVSQGGVNDVSSHLYDSLDGKAGADPAPNAAALYADAAYSVYQRGQAVDLSLYFSKKELDAYVPAYLSEGNFDGGQGYYLLPVAKSTEVFLLNKTDWDIFAAVTGATDASFATWEGLTEVAKQYYEWTDAQTPDIPNDGKAFFGRDAMANYMLVGAKQLGQEMFYRDGSKISYNYDEQTLRRLWDNYYVPFISGWFAANGRFRADDVKTGDCVALVGSTSSAAYFPTEVTRADGTSYPIVSATYPVPNFAGTEAHAVQQGAGMLILKSDKAHEQATATFLKWFTAQEQNLDFCVGSGYLPVIADANSEQAIQSAIDGSETVIPDALRETQRIGAQTVLNAELYTNPAFERGAEIRPILDKSLSEKAAADREQVLALAASQGISIEEAAAAYATDENFLAWAGSLRDALSAFF